MLTVRDLEIRVGARLLMSGVTFRVDDGDKIGLVGRNGAGKTTLTKVLAGEIQPTAGSITRHGEVGYLPQDPRSGNPEDLARTRILDARGLGTIVAQITQALGTHDGAFHADEVTACALLVLFDLVDQDKIIRSRDPLVLERCYFVCDVGGRL